MPSKKQRRSRSPRQPGRIYVTDLARIIDRVAHTIRQWEAHKDLPAGCYPRRDEKGWRYWSPDQVDRITAWLDTRRVQNPEKLAALRAPRKEQEEDYVPAELRPENRRDRALPRQDDDGYPPGCPCGFCDDDAMLRCRTAERGRA